MVWPLLCTGGNTSHGGLAGSSIVKTAGSGLEEAISETHLLVGNAMGLSIELPNWEFVSCDGIIAMGSHED